MLQTFHLEQTHFLGYNCFVNDMRLSYPPKRALVWRLCAFSGFANWTSKSAKSLLNTGQDEARCILLETLVFQGVAKHGKTPQHMVDQTINRASERQASGSNPDRRAKCRNDTRLRYFSVSACAAQTASIPLSAEAPKGALSWNQARKRIPPPAAAGIRGIGQSAFEGCFSLKSISIPADTLIHQYAFARCEQLTSVSLSSGITTIPHGRLQAAVTCVI